MAKQIGNLGVVVSANTLGFQRGMQSASAGVRQFAATARVAGQLAGQFDSTLIRMGADAATTAMILKNALPSGIVASVARFASLGGVLYTLIANFKALKSSAMSAAAAVEDFFSKRESGKDFMGFTPDTGPTMSADIQKQISLLRLQARVNRGEITKRQFLVGKNRVAGMGEFEASQLASAQLAAEKTDKKKTELSDRAMEMMREQRIQAQFEIDAAEQRLEIEREIASEREDAARQEYELSRQKIADAEQFAQDTAVALGLAKPSQFERDPLMRRMMEFREAADSQGGQTIGANFGVSSGSFFGRAPIGEVIGPQQETNRHLVDIKDLGKDFLNFLRSSGLATGAVIVD